MAGCEVVLDDSRNVEIGENRVESSRLFTYLMSSFYDALSYSAVYAFS
jgi:hypothetical protein